MRLTRDFRDQTAGQKAPGRKDASLDSVQPELSPLKKPVLAASSTKWLAYLCLILPLTLLFPFNVRAQQNSQAPPKGYEYGRYYIENLRDHGALIVRLNFKSKAINALLLAGNSNYATQIRYQQAEENTKIVQAFLKYFTFCPVYFIAYDSTGAFMEGRRTSIFLNSNLKTDSSIHAAPDFYLFAETGALETRVAADKLQPEQESTQRGLMDDVLIIRNADLNLLHDPFPYYVQRPASWEGRVKKLEKKFQQYYLKKR
ncbi:MAG: hypothetical protein K1X61_14390 [Chitinophagales bacterium]|nr:hypothetical protein [Chitinophagales bacterium]